MKWEEESASGLRKWSPFILLAVFVHVGVLWLAQDLSWLTPPKDSKLSPVKRVKLRDFTKPAQVKEVLAQEKDRDKDPKELDDKLQVVNLPPDHRAEAPDDAKFSATTDHSVEKQTISRFQTPGYENAGHELTKAAPSPKEIARSESSETDASEEASEAENVEPHDDKAPAAEPTELVENKDASEDTIRIDLGPPRKSLGDFARRRARPVTPEEEGGSGRPKKSKRELDRLIPDFRVLADLDSSPANDVVDEDIETGEGTYLNTKSFKYASFFNRFHRSVSRHWNPITEYRRRDPTGHVYGPRSRYTVLEVELDADGSLVSSRVLRSSGLDFLDREAIASLRRAQPFPNPPEGLLDDDRIFFSFGFQVKYGRR